MTQEKQLLLNDLCARLPYQPHVKFGDHEDGILSAVIWKGLYVYVCDWTYGHDYEYHLSEVKPYLRPMSSMTMEECKEYDSLCRWVYDEYNAYRLKTSESYDWLNEHHFDYRGLIEKGLALEALANMYKI